MVVTFYLRGLEWVDLLHNSHHPSPLLLTQTQIHYEEKHQPLWEKNAPDTSLDTHLRGCGHSCILFVQAVRGGVF